jgi:PKD repeat protein
MSTYKNKLFLLPLVSMVLVLYPWQQACKKIPLFASEGAVLIISTDKTYLKPGGDRAMITVIGFDSGGQALHDHTRVIFSATLGTVTPAETETLGGKAVVEFFSGSTGGVAEIRARSGNVTAEPDPLQVVIGSAALETLTISASPSLLPPGGGRVKIQVAAFDAGGNLLSDIPVVLSASSGQFENPKPVYYTDQQGIVEAFVNVIETAVVKAESSDKSVEVEIQVQEQAANQLPNADFTYSPSAPQRGEKVYFNGSPSFDPDGTIVSWEWDFGDGKTGSGETIAHAFNWSGEGSQTFTVVLKVTDDRGGSSISSKSIPIADQEDNQLPTADFSYSPSSPQKGETLYFNGSISSDPDGTITSWYWDFGDGSTGSGETVGHAYSWEGPESKTFTVILTVTDDRGGSDAAGKSITIGGEGENQAPTADFTYSPTSPKKGETVHFNGSLSSDPDGTIVSWAWDFGDGTTGTGEKTDHVYRWGDAGDKTFAVVLTVTDNNGSSDVTVKNVTVAEEEQNQLPTAGFSYTPTSPKKGDIVNFNAGSSYDPDGTIVSFQWDFGDGTTGTGETINHTFNWTESGDKTFVVVLRVVDNDGGEDTASISVTVAE